MKCPKCGQARPLADQVCRRCKYVFDEDRFLSTLEPPRAAGGRAPRRFFSSKSRPFLDSLRSRAWIPPVASLVPGLGHAIQGRWGLGLLYFVLVTVFGWLSVTYFATTSGQMLFGIMVSTHATCILDTTPWGRSPRLAARISAMAVVLPGLLMLYWPLIIRLAERFVPPQRREIQRGQRALALLEPNQIVVMVILFALSVYVSARMSRRMSSRGEI